ncbi:unnamed protein product, partial [Lepidochelys kempii]
YLPDVTGDGLVNQINNPEVEVDIGRPDLLTPPACPAAAGGHQPPAGGLRGPGPRLPGHLRGRQWLRRGRTYSEDWPAGGGSVSNSGSRPPDSRSPRKDRPGKGSRQNHRVAGSSSHAASWGGPALPLCCSPP